MRLALRAANDRYVRAVNGGDDAGLVYADAATITPDCVFDVQPVGDRWAIQTRSGRYFSAQGGGGAELQANRALTGTPGIRADLATAIGDWERWDMRNGGFLAIDGRHWLCAELNDTPNTRLNVTRTSRGPWETFVKEYIDAPVLPLHVDGLDFRDSAGQLWFYRGVTSFRLAQMFFDGADITPILDQYKSVGANLVRVLMMARNLFTFNPKSYGSMFWLNLSAFVDALAAAGFYVEVVAFADAQLLMPNPVDQQQHWQNYQSPLAGKPNVILELCNEPGYDGGSKNGVDPRRFAPLNGVLCSSGSAMDGEFPLGAPWQYATFHSRRDWKMFVTVPQTVAELNQRLQTRIVLNEPIGADETDAPGKRSTDVRGFCGYGMDSVMYAAGAAFHHQAGLQSALWGPTQQRCAEGFFKGMDAAATLRSAS